VNISVIRTIAGLLLAFALIGCDEDQPDPHSMTLAEQVVASTPMMARATVKVREAKKRSYVFNIVYPPSSYPLTVTETNATNLTRAMLRKLLADGQQPHDQKIDVHVWSKVTVPGSTGESGHRFDSFERAVLWTIYTGEYDSISSEECVPLIDRSSWRFGHCS
jgi:hypothetical protein